MSKNTFKIVFLLPCQFYNFKGQNPITFKDRLYFVLLIQYPNISIYLKSSELVLCMCMLMNISTHRSSDGEKPISKASLQKISFFTPS